MLHNMAQLWYLVENVYLGMIDDDETSTNESRAKKCWLTIMKSFDSEKKVAQSLDLIWGSFWKSFELNGAYELELAAWEWLIAQLSLASFFLERGGAGLSRLMLIISKEAVWEACQDYLELNVLWRLWKLSDFLHHLIAVPWYDFTPQRWTQSIMLCW